MKSLRIIALLLCMSAFAYADEPQTKVTVLPGSDTIPIDLMTAMVGKSNEICAQRYGTFAEEIMVFYTAKDQNARVSVRCAEKKTESKQKLNA